MRGSVTVPAMSFTERRRKPRRPLTIDQLKGIANYLTYGRIAMVPLIVFCLMGINDFDSARLWSNKFLSWVSMLLFVTAMVSDMIDGHYARKYGVISSFGKFIDPLADKLLSMSVSIMLVALLRVPAWIVILLVCRDVTITSLRSIAASEGLEISASDWGKKKTFAQSFAISFLLVHYPLSNFNPGNVGMVLLWVTLLISIGSGMHYGTTFFREVMKQKTGARQ